MRALFCVILFIASFTRPPSAVDAGELAPVILDGAAWWHDLPKDDWHRSGGNRSCAWRDRSGSRHLLLRVQTTDNHGELLARLAKSPDFLLVFGSRTLAVKLKPDSVWYGERKVVTLEIVFAEDDFSDLQGASEAKLVSLDPGWKAEAGLKVPQTR